MDEKKIEKLYELMERAKKEHDVEAVAALRWAIFKLENYPEIQTEGIYTKLKFSGEPKKGAIWRDIKCIAIMGPLSLQTKMMR